MNKGIDIKPREGVAAYCFLEHKKDTYMFAKRSATSKWQKNKWDLPGGKVDMGETVEDTIRREVKEETGQHIEELELIDTAPVHVKNKGRNVWVTKVFFYGKGKGKIILNGENSAYAVLSLKDAKKLDLVVGLDKIIQRFEKTHKPNA